MSISFIKNQNLKFYMENGFDQVDGWCEQMLFHTVDLIDSAPFNKQGGCCEIGVHHGKFFILLNSIVNQKETSYAIDVFDRQDLNIDQSGSGSKDIFLENLEKYDLHKGQNVKIIQGDSTDPALSINKIISPGSLKIISVDGGHTVEHTINDLKLSTELISNEGVVILDDILNPYWLGVVEGVVKFLENKPTLLPFAIGHNKLYMAKLSYAKLYKELFVSSPFFRKEVRFFGHTVAFL